ncbi:MAG TPA: ATP-binding protein [Acidimicrobiales bacterium]|nr:ATP-binding protein [Acidimicrobiales bacterium]
MTAVVGTTAVTRRKLAAGPGSASEARRTVSKACAEVGEEPLLEDAHSIASELVTNAVVHARTVIDLTVRAGGGAVRIAVGDGSHQRPTVLPTDVEALRGRGLMLVDALSFVWGIDPSPPGKTMRAQLMSPVPPSDAALAVSWPSRTSLMGVGARDSSWPAPTGRASG